MKLPRRPILLALLALAAPMSALAVSGNDGGTETLSVSTSLAGCGTTSNQVVCEINVSFNELDNADSYTASVTRADGSVVDYGSVPAGGTSLFVPYVGSGTYTVTITAYGDPESEGEPKQEIAKGSSDAGADSEGEDKESDGEAKLEGEQGEASEGEDDEQKPAGFAPAAGDESEVEACVEQPAPTVPPEPAKPPTDKDPANPDEDGDGIDDATEVAEYERLLAEREKALEAAGQATSADCP